MAEFHNAGVWPSDQRFPAQSRADDNFNFKKSRNTPKISLRAASPTPETSQTSLSSLFTVAIDDPAVPVTSTKGESGFSQSVIELTSLRFTTDFLSRRKLAILLAMSLLFKVTCDLSAYAIAVQECLGARPHMRHAMIVWPFNPTNMSSSSHAHVWYQRPALLSP